MSRRLVLLAATVLAAGSANAQRVDIDPARTTSFLNPILTQPGELIASEISESDFRMAGNRRTEQFAFAGRAGEVVSVQVRSDIPDLEVVVMDSSFSKILARGPAKDAPLRVTLPKDATYFIMVASKGPNRYGKYLLSIGTGQSAPSFDPPEPATPRVAQAAPQTPPTAPKPAAAAVFPVLTPSPGLLAAEIGKTIARPAGKPGTTVDVYQFIGEAGAMLQATAAGAGAYGVTLYTPEGAEMLTATGNASVTLTAALPQDAVYLLAVTRQDAAKPYKLSLAAEAPDIFQWSFRTDAGYEALKSDGTLMYWTCWAIPGSALRYIYPDGRTSTLTVGRGGDGRLEGEGGGYSFSTRLDGAQLVRSRRDNGGVQTWSVDDPPVPRGTYRGYLCK